MEGERLGIMEKRLVKVESKYGEALSKAVSWMDSRCKSKRAHKTGTLAELSSVCWR